MYATVAVLATLLVAFIVWRAPDAKWHIGRRSWRGQWLFGAFCVGVMVAGAFLIAFDTARELQAQDAARVRSLR